MRISLFGFVRFLVDIIFRYEVERMVKGAIFDLDGTILDSMHVWDDLADKYLLSIGVTPMPYLKDIFETMTTSMTAEWLIENMHVNKSVDEILDGFNSLLSEFYKDKVKLKKEFRECFNYLKERDIPMMIATSSERTNVVSALKLHGLDNEFKGILTCDELETDKTKPYIYLKGAEVLGEKPEDIVVFEDSYFCIKTAKEAGFKVCAVYDESNKKYMDDTKNIADYYFEYKELNRGE